MISLPRSQSEKKNRFWPRLGNLACLVMGGSVLWTMLRQVQQTRALLEKSMEEQRQGQRRLQEICERVLAVVQQLEEKSLTEKSGDGVSSLKAKTGSATRSRRQTKTDAADTAEKEKPQKRARQPRKQPVHRLDVQPLSEGEESETAEGQGVGE